MRYFTILIFLLIDVFLLYFCMKFFSLKIYEIIFVIVLFFIYEGIFFIRYDFWQETKKIYKALFFSYILALMLYIMREDLLSISDVTKFFLTVMIALPFEKRVVKRFVFLFDIFKQKVLVIGSKEQSRLLKKEIKLNWYLGQKVSDKKYETVFISSKDLLKEDFTKMIMEYLDKKREVYVVPYITDINFANSNIVEYSNIRLNTIKIENKLLIKQNILVKNGFDFVLAMVLFPILLPLHGVISLAIKLDSKGNILFKQKRLGKDNKTFKCYKYRTMYENSDEVLQKYLIQNPQEVEYYQKYHKYKNDPRITKVGRFLRASSLDELPQIFNILKGHMSFIGPRPYMINEEKELGENRDFILKVKPGITGLWQVSGRNNLTFKQRNELEVWYIKNWSLWFDFVILVKTIKVVLLKIGAK